MQTVQVVRLAQVGSVPSLGARIEPSGNRLPFGLQITFQPDLSSADRARHKAFQRIAPSVQYMIQHLNQPLHVPGLSAMVGLSKSSFFEHFKTATGRAPIDFLIRTRMCLAAWLVAETQLQIKEVAGALGYDDAFYFSRLFKSVHGLAPRNYRDRPARETTRNGKPADAKTCLDLTWTCPEAGPDRAARGEQFAFAATALPPATPQNLATGFITTRPENQGRLPPAPVV